MSINASYRACDRIAVSIERGRVHSVVTTGGCNGPYIHQELSPLDAYVLLKELQKIEYELLYLAENYYTCSMCAATHHKSFVECPNQ